MRKIIIICLALVFLSGCFSAKMVAPGGTDVKTLTESQSTTFKKDIKLWYALWGLVPITDNTSSKIIAENNLTEVRITTKFKFVDFVIGIFTSAASIVPMSMQIEGNISSDDGAQDDASDAEPAEHAQPDLPQKQTPKKQ